MSKVALVTGGTYGIGRAISLALEAEYKVVALWRSTAPQGLPPSLHPMQADLTDTDQSAAVIAQIIETYGRLDLIVNNAGFAQATPRDHFDAQTHRTLFETNLMAPSALLTAALPHLQRGASVVNISSVNAVLPPEGAAMFGASKAALNLWTKAMAKELGPSGIRVNAVAPGAITIPEAPRRPEQTAFFVKDTALGRIGTPQDIAKVVRFLASENAAFITGQIVEVSGGYRL